MPTCIAPGCKSGYKSQVTKSVEPGYERISFFTVPEDPAIIALWQQSLNRKDFTVKAGQFVCCKHFLKDNILHEKILIGPDGTILGKVSILYIFTIQITFIIINLI